MQQQQHVQIKGSDDNDGDNDNNRVVKKDHLSVLSLNHPCPQEHQPQNVGDDDNDDHDDDPDSHKDPDTPTVSSTAPSASSNSFLASSLLSSLTKSIAISPPSGKRTHTPAPDATTTPVTLFPHQNDDDQEKLHTTTKMDHTEDDDDQEVARVFETHSYQRPTKCYICNGLLVGLWCQGLQVSQHQVHAHAHVCCSSITGCTRVDNVPCDVECAVVLISQSLPSNSMSLPPVIALFVL